MVRDAFLSIFPLVVPPNDAPASTSASPSALGRFFGRRGESSFRGPRADWLKREASMEFDDDLETT